jgi:hypothetical protein
MLPAGCEERLERNRNRRLRLHLGGCIVPFVETTRERGGRKERRQSSRQNVCPAEGLILGYVTLFNDRVKAHWRRVLQRRYGCCRAGDLPLGPNVVALQNPTHRSTVVKWRGWRSRRKWEAVKSRRPILANVMGMTASCAPNERAQVPMITKSVEDGFPMPDGWGARTARTPSVVSVCPGGDRRVRVPHRVRRRPHLRRSTNQC